MNQLSLSDVLTRFNTQPPEGGWQVDQRHAEGAFVSTHSRPKAAGRDRRGTDAICRFNTQPPEGGWPPCPYARAGSPSVSTHSRPKAAGFGAVFSFKLLARPFQHTAARGRLTIMQAVSDKKGMFQHTAARGRLTQLIDKEPRLCLFQHTAARGRLNIPPATQSAAQYVSTHSRPWAADAGGIGAPHLAAVSTHSRPWAAEALSESLANPGKNRLFSLKTS